MKQISCYLIILISLLFVPLNTTQAEDGLPTVEELATWTYRFHGIVQITPTPGSIDHGFRTGKCFIFKAPENHATLTEIMVMVTKGSDGKTYALALGCLYKGEGVGRECDFDSPKEWENKGSELYAGY